MYKVDDDMLILNVEHIWFAVAIVQWSLLFQVVKELMCAMCGFDHQRSKRLYDPKTVIVSTKQSIIYVCSARTVRA